MLKLRFCDSSPECITMAGELKLPLKTFRFRVKDRRLDGREFNFARNHWRF